MKKKRPPLTAATMGPGTDRFAPADLSQAPHEFVRLELAKPPAARFEAVCFDARRTPMAEILAWIDRLDDIEREEDVNPANSHGYYIRRVLIVKSRRAMAVVPKAMQDRPDVTWIATADPADAPTIYRRHLTEQFQGVLDLFGGPKRKRSRKPAGGRGSGPKTRA